VHSLNKLETVGQRMAARRLQLGLTQKEVASQLNVTPKSGRKRGVDSQLSRNAYGMYEIDEAEPDLKKIARIAEVLRVSPGWLAFGTDVSPRLHEVEHDAKRLEDGKTLANFRVLVLLAR
jgi:transcriptional regulator with XRE-family HTH domain